MFFDKIVISLSIYLLHRCHTTSLSISLAWMPGIKGWWCFEIRITESMQLLKIANLTIASNFRTIKNVWHGGRINMVYHWPIKIDTFIYVRYMLILYISQHMCYTIIHWFRPQGSSFIPLLVFTLAFLLFLLLLLAFHDKR